MGGLLVNRWIHTLVLLGILGGSIFVRSQEYSWIKSLRNIAFDTYNELIPREATEEAVVVDIDERSMAHPQLGQFPWSRNVMADLVNKLTEMGASAVVFDIVFAERDRTSPQVVIEKLPEELKQPDFMQSVSELPDNDDVFAEAIEKSGRIVTGFVWNDDEEATIRKPKLIKPILLAKHARNLTDSVNLMPAVTTNLPLLSGAAAGNGCFGAFLDEDGIIRRVPLLFRFEDPERDTLPIIYPSLALEALRVSQGAKTLIKVRAYKPGEAGPLDPPLVMNVGKYDVPMDWDGEIVGYYSKARPEKYISVADVLFGSVDESKIKDKVVFVGTSAQGLRDIRSTPLDLFIPGVEVHINVFEQIVSGQFLTRPDFFKGVEVLVILGVGLLIIFLAPFVGTVFVASFTMLLITTLVLASWYAFKDHGMLLDPVYPSLCLLSLFIMSSLLTYMRSEAERKQVREAFGLYISPDFMEELTKNPDKLELGGETRELTVMFTDIRNFTTIAESMSPEALIQLMNDFLTPMSDQVMDTRGTIDKYMGDAMMAFWNAPLDNPNHARNACYAALKMNETLKPINEEIRLRAEAERKQPVMLQAGIGVNTGTASVGNMGSKKRFAYSAMGDTVNLASRLEGQTKAYGVDILIGENTYKQAPEFAVLELDLIRVKGKNEPVRVYTLLGDETLAKDDVFLKWRETHLQMLAAYRTRQFDEALELINKCRTLSNADIGEYYTIFQQRIEELKTSPPPRGWDGVYVATSK